MIPSRYQPSMEMLAEFIRKHPWWQWLTRTPFSAKMTKYALSSVIAFALSNVAFAFCYWLGWGTTVPSVIAFFAAAIPNWIMNRRWAWQQTGRAPTKQIISYAAVSAVVLLVTAWSTGRVNHWVKYDINVANHHGLRLLIVTAAFVLINVVLFFAKFAVYEYVIFAEERGHRGLHRHHAEANPAATDAPAGSESPARAQAAEGEPVAAQAADGGQAATRAETGPAGDEREPVLSSSPTE